MVRLTITIPDDVYEQMLFLQGYYGLKSFQNLIVLGSDLLKWIQIKNDTNYTFLAIKKDGDRKIIYQLPLKKLPTISNDDLASLINFQNKSK